MSHAVKMKKQTEKLDLIALELTNLQLKTMMSSLLEVEEGEKLRRNEKQPFKNCIFERMPWSVQ
jgi:hypothetical protein